MPASQRKHNTHIPSASKAYTRNLSFRQTCVSGQQGYTMLWLWLLLEARRNHTRSAWWPCVNYKTSLTILQGRSATNVTRYFKCVLPCQPILHQGDLSFLRAKFMPNTSRSPTVSSPRTQTDDRTKACCKVLVGLWSVTIMSPFYVRLFESIRHWKLRLFYCYWRRWTVESRIVTLQYYMIQITMTLNSIMNLICRFICIAYVTVRSYDTSFFKVTFFCYWRHWTVQRCM